MGITGVFLVLVLGFLCTKGRLRRETEEGDGEGGEGGPFVASFFFGFSKMRDTPTR
jgi:hypothetical protein